MRICVGWSGQVGEARQKVDVELEEADGQREWPEVWPRLCVRECLQLLQNLAESTLLKKLIEFEYPEDKAAARQAQLAASTESVLAKYTEE